MNKQEKNPLMTTYHNINKANIILLFLRNRSFKEVGFNFKLNYHTLTVLLGLYLHSTIHDNKGVRVSNLVKFIGYYDCSHLRRYLDNLIGCNMVRLDKGLYYISEEGLLAIRNISDRSERLVYDFCQGNSMVL